MTFEEYLIGKNIDSEKFKLHESRQWEEWKVLFEKIGSNSFTAQKLYLINPVRRKYQLPLLPAAPSSPPLPKPVFKPKIS